MVTQTDASRSWRPVFLISCLFTAALLLSSWWWPVTREYWDALDAAAFYWLHGSILDGGNDWRVFWAYANTRPIDGISALLFASIFFTWIWRGGWSSAPERLAEGFFLFGVTVMVLHVSSNVIFTFDRLSPSLVLEPVFRLSEVVTSVKVKDVSGNSFPGDHGTAVSLFTLFIWAFSGWKRGVAALVLAVLAVLPRLMGGTLDNRSGGRQRLDRSCYGGADLRHPIREMVHRIRRFSAAQSCVGWCATWRCA